MRSFDQFDLGGYVLPSIDLGADTTLCQGEEISLYNKVDGDYENRWSDGQLADTILIRQDIIIGLKVNDSFCMNQDSISISFERAPNPIPTRDTFFCDSESVNLKLDGKYKGLVEWDDGDTSLDKCFNRQEEVLLFYSNGVCDVTDSITINNYQRPAIFKIHADDTLYLCPKESILLNSSWPFKYVWNDTSFVNQWPVNNAGIVWLDKYESSGNCFVSDTVYVSEVHFNSVLPTDTTKCFNQTLILKPDSVKGENFTWNTGEKTRRKQVNVGENFVVLTRKKHGCTAFDSITVYFADSIILLNNDTFICNEDPFKGQIRAQGQQNIEWTTKIRQGTNRNFEVTSADPILQVTLTNNQCQLIDSVFFSFIEYPQPSWPDDTTSCNKDTLQLSISNDYDKVVWSDGTTNLSLGIIREGRVSVEITKQDCIDTFSTVVSFSSTPIIPKEFADTTLCADQSALVIDFTENDYSVKWSDGLNDLKREINMTGAYGLQISNNCGIDSSSIKVTKMEFGCALFLPSSFSPNGDGLNDYFTYVSELPKDQIINFWIYNQNGTIIYELEESMRWDGRFKGKEVQEGNYHYIFDYYVVENAIKIRKRIENSFYLMR